jgi:hypothetical protein
VRAVEPHPGQPGPAGADHRSDRRRSRSSAGAWGPDTTSLSPDTSHTRGTPHVPSRPQASFVTIGGRPVLVVATRTGFTVWLDEKFVLLYAAHISSGALHAGAGSSAPETASAAAASSAAPSTTAGAAGGAARLPVVAEDGAWPHKRRVRPSPPLPPHANTHHRSPTSATPSLSCPLSLHAHLLPTNKRSRVPLLPRHRRRLCNRHNPRGDVVGRPPDRQRRWHPFDASRLHDGVAAPGRAQAPCQRRCCSRRVSVE